MNKRVNRLTDCKVAFSSNYFSRVLKYLCSDTFVSQQIPRNDVTFSLYQPRYSNCMHILFDKAIDCQNFLDSICW